MQVEGLQWLSRVRWFEIHALISQLFFTTIHAHCCIQLLRRRKAAVAQLTVNRFVSLVPWHGAPNASGRLAADVPRAPVPNIRLRRRIQYYCPCIAAPQICCPVNPLTYLTTSTTPLIAMHILRTASVTTKSIAGWNTGICQSWCGSRPNSWSRKCKWKDCNGCSACAGSDP